MASVLALMASILKSNNETQQAQLQQTKRRSNLNGPHISAFNPRGQKDYPMPELKCEIHAPWQIKPGIHGLDREEVELFNLLEPGIYPIELTDGSRRVVSVVGSTNTITGKLEQMVLAGAYDPGTKQHGALFTKEDKQLFPSLKQMLRQMLGDAATGVMSKLEEQRRIALPADDPRHLAVSVGA